MNPFAYMLYCVAVGVVFGLIALGVLLLVLP